MSSPILWESFQPLTASPVGVVSTERFADALYQVEGSLLVKEPFIQNELWIHQGSQGCDWSTANSSLQLSLCSLGITDSRDVSLSKLPVAMEDRKPGGQQAMRSQKVQTRPRDWTTARSLLRRVAVAPDLGLSQPLATRQRPPPLLSSSPASALGSRTNAR